MAAICVRNALRIHLHIRTRCLGNQNEPLSEHEAIRVAHWMECFRGSRYARLALEYEDPKVTNSTSGLTPDYNRYERKPIESKKFGV
jgi:hypothetical protein